MERCPRCGEALVRDLAWCLRCFEAVPQESPNGTGTPGSAASTEPTPVPLWELMQMVDLAPVVTFAPEPPLRRRHPSLRPPRRLRRRPRTA